MEEFEVLQRVKSGAVWVSSSVAEFAPDRLPW